jgi:predicted Holliday junction resolvase-like endonuclease
MQTPLSSGFVAVCALLIAAVVVIVLLWRRYESLLQDHDQSVRDARRESVDQSRSTLKGRIAEQMAPLLQGFAYLPADSRFIGSPIDYVVFSGYSEFADAEADPEGLEIVLLEVKKGRAPLTPIQRAIGQAVEEGRVRFEVTRIAEDGSVVTNEWRPGKRVRA